MAASSAPGFMASPYSTYYAIPTAYGLAVAPHVYYLSKMMLASKWSWNNVAPRSNWETLKAKVPSEVYEKCLRARGAHLNALEGFPLFAAAILAGTSLSSQGYMTQGEVRSMALTYLGVRMLYTFAYIGIRNEFVSYLRTGLWGWSVALPVWTLVRCANAKFESS